MITIDFGTNYNGYWSDISRVVALGQPSEKMLEVQQAVLRSFTNCATHIKPGLTDQEVDKYMRDILIETGYNHYSGTGTGHGIGLEVHENRYSLWTLKKYFYQGWLLRLNQESTYLK